MDINSAKKVGRNPSNESASLRHNGRNFLMLIGIDQYAHSHKLNNAVRDAQGFKNILLRKYQFQEEYCYELLDDKATRKNILEVLSKLESNITEEDNFILYYSGHGTMNQKKTKGFWIPVDAESVADYIPNSQIKDHLDEIQARHIYLIIDSCFSGSMVKRSNEFTKRVETFPSRRVLTSGRNEEVSDGKIGSHSPFAHCILEYLKNHNGPLPASQLEQHVKENTPKSSNQTPASAYIHGLGDQGGEFVFHPREKQMIPNPTINPRREKNIPHEMIWIKGGEFLMGNEGPKALEHEKPMHKVKVKGFYIDQHPVTVKQFRQFVEATNYKTLAERRGEISIGGVIVKGVNWRYDVMGNIRTDSEEDHPVIFVSWHDAKAYADYVGKRLPYESEWEFTAKESVYRKKDSYSGSKQADEVAWYVENAGGTTHTVKQKDPNNLGVYDMCGLVWEWCEDYYEALYYQQKVYSHPKGPEKGNNKVLRGGCWASSIDKIRVSHRYYGAQDLISGCVGFRCVSEKNF